LSQKVKDYRSKVAIYSDILQVIDENGGRAGLPRYSRERTFPTDD